MPASLFKHDLPQSIEDMLISLANNDNDGSVTFDKPSYKSAKIRGTLYPFLNILFDYYHQSTCHYVNCDPTYTRFLTIVRQVLTNRKINFTNSYVSIKHTRYAIVKIT